MKSLKDKYKQLFNGKPMSNDKGLINESFGKAGIATGKRTVNEAGPGSDRRKEFQSQLISIEILKEFQSQLDEITSMLQDLTDEFGYELEMTADIEDLPEYRQWLTQLGRYSSAAEKNLKGLGKIIKQAYGGL
jgi:hypothetical protein